MEGVKLPPPVAWVDLKAWEGSGYCDGCFSHDREDEDDDPLYTTEQLHAFYAAGVAAGLYQAVNISALYSSGLERLHPDVPWGEMSEEVKRIAHWTAQNIAAAIDAAIQKE